jgi:hypothetical protein
MYNNGSKAQETSAPSATVPVKLAVDLAAREQTGDLVTRESTDDLAVRESGNDFAPRDCAYGHSDTSGAVCARPSVAGRGGGGASVSSYGRSFGGVVGNGSLSSSPRDSTSSSSRSDGRECPSVLAFVTLTPCAPRAAPAARECAACARRLRAAPRRDRAVAAAQWRSRSRSARAHAVLVVVVRVVVAAVLTTAGGGLTFERGSTAVSVAAPGARSGSPCASTSSSSVDAPSSASSSSYSRSYPFAGEHGGRVVRLGHLQHARLVRVRGVQERGERGVDERRRHGRVPAECRVRIPAVREVERERARRVLGRCEPRYESAHPRGVREPQARTALADGSEAC